MPSKDREPSLGSEIDKILDSEGGWRRRDAERVQKFLEQFSKPRFVFLNKVEAEGANPP